MYRVQPFLLIFVAGAEQLIYNSIYDIYFYDATAQCYITCPMHAFIALYVSTHVEGEIRGLKKMDINLQMDDTFDFVNMLLSYVADKISQVSKIDVVIALLLAADVISLSNDEDQAVSIEKIAQTSYIGGVVKNVCHYLQHDSGIAFMVNSTTCKLNHPRFLLIVPCEQRSLLFPLLVDCLMQWTHFSSLLCKELGKANVLQFLTSTLHAFFRSKPPSEVC